MNLIEGIQKECNRARELKSEYDKIQFGRFGSEVISAAIKKGEDAIACGDCVEMVTALKHLQSLE